MMQQKTSESDEELVKRTIERDAHAFEILFDRYTDMLHRHVTSILHDEMTANDVVQETFVRVWTRAGQWRGTGPFKAWLYRTATNIALNQLRSSKRRREVPLEIPKEPDDEDYSFNAIPGWMVEASSLGPEAVVLASEERARRSADYRRLVNRLPEDKREILRLVHEMEMSIRDAADTLDIPEGTVKSRLHYARKTMANEWRKMQEGE
jgi:RNA polymerase sigma-70 factor (ECF subfamily)